MTRRPRLAELLALSLAAVTGTNAVSDCADVLSCSSEAAIERVNACCTPAPAGLFVFRQRFEPDVGSDMGSWGIDGIDVLECFSQKPATRAVAPPYTHEEIGSFCHRSSLFDGEQGFLMAESEWAQSEVGEGMEEVWSRAWMNSGRFISTLAPHCNPDSEKGYSVASFFHVLHKLHGNFTTAKYLAEADITPSSDTTYSLEELTNALSFDQHKPVLECINSTLSSVLWPLNVRGLLQDGNFTPSQIYSHHSNCPLEGIIYQPSTTLPRPTTTYAWDPLIRPSPRPITLSHDESKVYYQQPQRDTPQKLGFFKGTDEERDDAKGEKAGRRFVRDEL
ncbi:ribonuclease T2-like protein [Naematelia encephala]|uniref:Ribonuclease T2-like protein n=1 Tax=Naematelia encephala TaxID=71784 RepID=A0A1Y2BGT7_9TREE|nr:ribonuclease T2-like protein [Naematelia encephala]